jgi:hypothetical protein
MKARLSNGLKTERSSASPGVGTRSCWERLSDQRGPLRDVCEWVSDRGEYSDERIFIKTLVGNRFTQKELVQNKCGGRGIAAN